jgi:hypothetical protein
MMDNDTSFFSSICRLPDLSNISNLPLFRGKFSNIYINYEDFLTVSHMIIFYYD